MKIIKYIPFLLSLVFALGACTDDDKTFYNSNETEPGKLNEIQATYTLDPLKENEKFETFEWGKTLYNFDAAVTYTLEADIAGNNFQNPQELTASNALTADVNVKTINSTILRLAGIYGIEEIQAHNIEFRVRASAGNSPTYAYTNIISASITPYPADIDYPKVWVIGDYSGWLHDNSQFLFAFNGGDEYQGWIFFDGKAANGFKITGAADWDNGNWGLQSGQTPENEASSITLWDDGGSQNIQAYSKNYYRFLYNTTSLELQMLKSMDHLGIIGDGANGWGDNDDIVFEFDTEKQVFVATVTLKDGEIKFRADNKWDFNFGQLKDGESGVLAEGGDNIPVTAGTYKITVNINNPDNMTYRIETGEALDPSRITAPVLTAHNDLNLYTNKSDDIAWSVVDFGGQDPANVQYTIELALKGTEFANAQTLGTTRDASLTVTGDQYLAALEALGGAIDTPADVDIRVTAAISGLTDPFISNTVSFKLTVETAPEYATELYMTGAEFGNWFNDASGVVKMIPVYETPGTFWTVRYFTAGQGFKWAPQIGWSNDFAELGEKEGYNIEGGNAVVATNGLYMVYIDMPNDKITIEPAKIYGMGDAFGSWDMGAHPFTIEGNKASITATNASSELRMYAGSSAATGIDWWKMEFILRDGVIEYRGNGGDQNPRVAVAAGDIITLDFNAGTGIIE